MKKARRAGKLVTGLASLVGLAGCQAGPSIVPGRHTHNAGYRVQLGADSSIRAMAGVLAGTATIQRVPNGYRISGSYSQAQHPGAYAKICKAADTDKDKVVTRSEVHKYARKFQTQHASRN